MPRGLSYIAAQLAGSILGAGLVVLTCPAELMQVNRKDGVLGMPFLPKDDTQVASFIAEVMGTALITAVYWTAISEDEISPQVKSYMLGAAMFIAQVCFYKHSGACFNPIFVFGPSLMAKNLENYHWLYWFGPVIGALITSYALDKISRTRDDTMSKKRIAKEIKQEKEIEMEREDIEFERKKKLAVNTIKEIPKKQRDFELSDDEGLDMAMDFEETSEEYDEESFTDSGDEDLLLE